MLISVNLTDKSLKAFARFAKVGSMANCARVGRLKTRICTTNHIVLLIVGVSNRWVWGGHNWVKYIKLIYPLKPI